MNTILLFFLFCITFCVSLQAQENPKIEKSEFRENETGFKEAWDNVKDGDNFYEKGSWFYKEALPHYLNANKYNSKNPALNYKIGVCYLYSDNKKASLEHLRRAFDLGPQVAKDLHYWLGKSWHINLRFDLAIEEYNMYRKSLKSDEMSTIGVQLDKYIQECNNGIELVKKPVRVFIDNMGDKINSKASDYSPLISADESKMIFTSKREGSTGNKIDPYKNCLYEDIYETINKEGQWQQAVNVGEPLNSEKNDATVGMSPDGQLLFTFMEGDIYMSKLQGDKWLRPYPLSSSVNSEFREATACFSPDGNTMYFVSENDDVNFGGRDVFLTVKDRKGKWGPPINLGDTINTPYDEMSAFLHPDGKTLYFSSKGHNSMGGFDIFRSQWNGKTWSVPENLGYPINTPEDDLFFIMAANGRIAYYSSIQPGGFGDHDIYKITFLHPEITLESSEDNMIAELDSATTVSEKANQLLQSQPSSDLTLISGIVREQQTTKPIEASIEIVDNDLNEVVSTFTSNSKSGYFLISLPSGKNYGIAVQAEGYLFYSENINTKSLTGYHDIRRDINLQRIIPGAKIILTNVFFETAKADLQKQYDIELKRLVEVLQKVTNIKIEISGHTDNVGSADYNNNLSKTRAKSVVEYLILHGIASDRLTYVGKGFSEPVAPNDSDEGRQMNRRVEFRIVSIK